MRLRAGIRLWTNFVLLFLSQSQSSQAGCTPVFPDLNTSSNFIGFDSIRSDAFGGKQILFSASHFTGCGEITTWSMKGECLGRDERGNRGQLQFQIWRLNNSTGQFERKRYLDRRLSTSNCRASVKTFSGLTGLTFQPYDFIGIFLPPTNVPTFEILLDIKILSAFGLESMLNHHQSFTRSQPATTLRRKSRTSVYNGIPQISIQVNGCKCISMTSPPKTGSPPAHPLPPSHPSSSPPSTNTLPSFQGKTQKFHSGMYIIIGTVMGATILTGGIVAMVIILVVCRRKMDRVSTIGVSPDQNRTGSEKGNNEDDYYSIPMTPNPGYRSVSNLAPKKPATAIPSPHSAKPIIPPHRTNNSHYNNDQVRAVLNPKHSRASSPNSASVSASWPLHSSHNEEDNYSYI